MFIPQVVKQICQSLNESGLTVYFSSITARELLLRQQPSSFISQTDADLVSLAQLDEAMEFPGRLDYDARLLIEETEILFKTFKRPPGGADFCFLKDMTGNQLVTVNTFLYEYGASRFLDPYDAYQHLRSSVLVPAPQFREALTSCPSKIFDLLYLHSQRDFTFSAELSVLWGKYAIRTESLTAREIRDGLASILTSKEPYHALMLLDSQAKLTALFPELLPTLTVPQDKDHHPEGNIYEHTLECFKHVSRPSLTLALALLFHDIGKPDTAVFQKNLRFPRHGQVGSRIARKIMRRLKFDEALAEDVAFLISHHLVAHELRIRNEAQKIELLQHRLFPELMKLYKADIQSCFGDMGEYHKVLSLYKKAPKIQVVP